jgi:CzcA family heavy metal efflux pump
MTSSGGGLQRALIGFSVRYRRVVIALSVTFLAFGAFALGQVRYDVFPEFAMPQVAVRTEAPGLSPEQVEILVSQPIENAVNGVEGLRSLRSASIQGLSIITASFDPSSDVQRDRQIIAERLTTVAGRLPDGVREPEITPFTSSTSIVLVAGLTSKTRSAMDLRTEAEWSVRPRLLAVPGVSKVAIFGGESRSLQIQLRPERLTALGLGIGDLLAAARQATGVRGAGFVDTANQRLVIEARGQTLDLDAIRAIVIPDRAPLVTLGSVADIAWGAEPPTGGATIQGESGVEFEVSGQYGVNTVEVARRVEAALAEMRPALEREGFILHDDLFRPAGFIDHSIRNVGMSLLLGGGLVILVIFLFLFDIRAAAASCMAIPLSLLASIIGLNSLGYTLNTMTLGGLAIAIGVVVDDAVIDVENIYRRLRENRAAREPRRAGLVVIDACMEVRSAVLYATMAVILVVFPIVALTGLAGRLFAPLGIAYALAVLASLVVAFTVTPALSMAFFGRRALSAAEPPLVRLCKQGYRRILHAALPHPRVTGLAVLLLTVAAAAIVPLFGANLIPRLQEGHFILHMAALPGSSIGESQRLGARVTAILRSLPEVRSVAQRIGRAEMADDVMGTHYSEFEVDLRPLASDAEARVQNELRQRLAALPGVNFAINTFLAERVEETLSGFTASVVVNIYGRDLDELDNKAEEIAGVLRAVPGATDVQLPSPPGMPQLIVQLRWPDLRRYGFTPIEVMEALRTAYQGETVGQEYDGARTFPVLVILPPDLRNQVVALKALPLRSAMGVTVRLDALADVKQGSGRFQVSHQNAQRLQTIVANVAGRDIDSFVAEAKAQVARKVALPQGSYVQFTGEAEAQKQASRDLAVNAALAGVGIVLLLSIITGSGNNLLLVLVNLPFAFVGGVLAVAASGGVMSLGSMVGFVALFGITLRNSILMIARFEQLVVEQGLPWTAETALKGALDRVVPVLMTSLVTALGVLPLALAMRRAGHEIEGPMAIVILGGLLTSMVLNLLVLPTLALRFGKFNPPDTDL